MYEVPTLRGLQSPKLFYGIDIRILVAVVVLVIVGIIAWPVWIIAALLVIAGLALGRVNSFFIDELWTYMNWRMDSWSGLISDEGFEEHPKSDFLKNPRRIK